MFQSVLHYPCGVIPVTEVREGEDQQFKDNYNDNITAKIRETIKGSVGMPIGTQVVTQKWKDEECLAVMKILDNQIKFRKRPPVAQMQ